MNTTIDEHKVARRAELTFILDLANKHRRELGFLPRAAFIEYIERDQIWLTCENEQPAGYVLWRPPRPDSPIDQPRILRIIHACVQFDARRALHATRLINELEAQVTLATLDYVTCWCADDLEANAFWHAIGFEHYATREFREHNRIRRIHNAWIRRAQKIPYEGSFVPERPGLSRSFLQGASAHCLPTRAPSDSFAAERS